MTIRKIGVVMAVVNCQEYSQQTYESLMLAALGRQEIPDIRWFIIDQASTDGTRAWVECLLAYGHAIEYLPQNENIGVTKAWNMGIAKAFDWGADAVLVANNDIVFASDYLEKLLPWVEDEEEIFVTGRQIGTHPSEFGEIDGRAPCAKTHDWLPYPQFTQFLLTHEVLDKLGGPLFDEGYVIAYFEDNDAVERMAAAGIRAGSVGDAHITHYGSRSIHEGGVRHQHAFNLNEMRFVKKYGYLPSSGVRPAHLPPIQLRPERRTMNPYRVLPEKGRGY